MRLIDKAKLVACPLCDEMSCEAGGVCERVRCCARDIAGKTLLYRNRPIEQGDEIRYATQDDERWWTEALGRNGYTYVPVPGRRSLKILKLPEVE